MRHLLDSSCPRLVEMHADHPLLSTRFVPEAMNTFLLSSLINFGGLSVDYLWMVDQESYEGLVLCCPCLMFDVQGGQEYLNSNRLGGRHLYTVIRYLSDIQRTSL